MDYKDKVIIVIGGGSDLGRTVALQYAQAGGNVVVVDSNERIGRESVDLIYEQAGHGIFLQGDMTIEQDVCRVLERVIHFYNKIDVLINIIGATYHKSILELSLEEWKENMNTNLSCVFLTSKEVIKYMQGANTGAIVNILSSQPIITSVEAEVYNVVKEGIITMTKSLASSLWNYQIQVNCLSPGVVKPKMYTRLKEMGYDEVMDMGLNNLEDIARACLHLTDKDNDYLNGSNFILDHDLIRKVVYMG